MNAADDVDDGVKRADFVKMNFVGRCSVNGALHFTESSEQRLRTRLAARTQPRAIDERVDLRERSVRVRFGRHPAMRVMVMSAAVLLSADLELCRADSRALHTLGPECITIDGQAPQRRPDVVERNACIDQSGVSPAIRLTKLRRSAAPWGVWMTSGWNINPK